MCTIIGSAIAGLLTDIDYNPKRVDHGFRVSFPDIASCNLREKQSYFLGRYAYAWVKIIQLQPSKGAIRAG